MMRSLHLDMAIPKVGCGLSSSVGDGMMTMTTYLLQDDSSSGKKGEKNNFSATAFAKAFQSPHMGSASPQKNTTSIGMTSKLS